MGKWRHERTRPDEQRTNNEQVSNGMAHINGPNDGLRELALFAGAGGGILGGKLLGWRCVCAVEWEPYPAAVLARRQDEGFLPPFPIWDDVQTFDGRPWRGLVDVVSGGFPCQDISSAGKGAGITGERSGMWKHMARIIGEVRPRYVLVENSPILTSKGLGVVLGDLAAMGYDAEWGVLSAAHAGAPHRRERLWILASNANGDRLQGRDNEAKEGRQRQNIAVPPLDLRVSWPEVSSPRAFGDMYGVSREVDRVKSVGNAQVPAVVRLAWHTLHERLTNR